MKTSAQNVKTDASVEVRSVSGHEISYGQNNDTLSEPHATLICVI